MWPAIWADTVLKLKARKRKSLSTMLQSQWFAFTAYQQYCRATATSSTCRGAKAMPYIQVWSPLAIFSCQLQPNARRCETIQTILAPYGHSFFEFGVVHKAIPTDAVLCIHASHRWLESSRSESYLQLPQQSSSSIIVLFDKPQCPRGGKLTAIVPSQAWSVISL